MQMLDDDDDDDMVSSSPTSVSSGYCSQWMSPNNDAFSKQSSSERTTCAESEFESDHGVHQKLLGEFHSIPPKTHKGRSQLPSSGVQVTQKKLTCARQCRKSVHHELEVLNCMLTQLNSASFPHKRNAVRSSSSGLRMRALDESPLKSYSLNSGHVIDSSDTVLPSAKPFLSKKRSKPQKKRLTSQHACKVRYVKPTVSICRLPAGIISMNVKNIGNSLCWFQSAATHMLDLTNKHKRTKTLNSNCEILQPQSNSSCKQLQSYSCLKHCQSQSLKQQTSKSKCDVKYAKLSHNSTQLALTDVKRHRWPKCEVTDLTSNKCKDSSYEADIEEERHKITDERHSCDVIHNSRSVSAKSKDVESYKVEQIQYTSISQAKSQNPISFCSVSDMNRPIMTRLNHERCSVEVSGDTHGRNDGTVHEVPSSHCVSASGFHKMKDKLDSHVSAYYCHGMFGSVKHDEKPRDTLENLIKKNHHRRRRVKCRITDKSEYRCRECHWIPCYSAHDQVQRPTPTISKYVIPKNYHKLSSSMRYSKYQKSSTNTDTHANGAYPNEADRIPSSDKFPYSTDIQTKGLRRYSERGVKPNCRNLFETFLNEIPSTNRPQNLTEEVLTKPEKCAIQKSDKHHHNSLVLKSDYSINDLSLIEPSDLSVQPTTENSRTELFEPNASLLDTNDDMYSDISDDISPDAVSTTYDMFSDISDCIPDDLPINQSTNDFKLSDTGRNMLPHNRAPWANDLHSMWLQSQLLGLPTTSGMSLKPIKTSATESHNEKRLTHSPCSDNHEKQKGLSIAKEISCGQNESSVCEHSSSQVPGKVLACKTHCSVETEKRVSIHEETASIQGQKELLGFGLQNTLEPVHNSEEFLSNNISKGKLLTYEGPYEFGVNDEEEVSEIPCSQKSLVEKPYSEGPMVSEVLAAKEGHIVFGAPCNKEDLLFSDETCLKRGHLTSVDPFCKAGSKVSEVVLKDYCSREELLISEGQTCKERPLIPKEPVSNIGFFGSSYTNEDTAVSDIPCFKEVCVTSEEFSPDGVIVSETPCLGMIKKEILILEATFSDVSHEESEIHKVSGSNMLQTGLTGCQKGFSCVQEFEDLLTAGASCLSDTTDVSLILEDLFPFVLQEPSEGIADSLNYEDFVSCDMQQGSPATSQIENTKESSLTTQTSCLATVQEDDVDSLDEAHNECISDSNGTSCKTVPCISGLTMPRHLARARTKSWLQEYQSQMLENQHRTHKNWKLLVSVIDDDRPGRKCAQRKSTLGNRSRKRKSSPETNKTGHQPKRSCNLTCNSEQTEPEPNEDLKVLQQDLCGVDLTSQSNFPIADVLAAFQNMVLNGDPNMLSLFLDQDNTWLSMENIETTIDQTDLRYSGPTIHSEHQFTTLPASDSVRSDTFCIAPLETASVDSASALPIQQPESIMSRELPELVLNSAAAIDSEALTMFAENCGNVESLNVSSLDVGSNLNAVASEVSDLDPETLQYLLSVLIQSRSAGVLPGISNNQGNEFVINMDVNRGIISVLNNSSSVTQPVDCSQTVGCDPVQECNKQVKGQTFTPGLILPDGINMFAKVNNPKSAQHSDSGVCVAQNSIGAIGKMSSEVDSHPAQNNCPVMDVGEIGISDTAIASNLEQNSMINVVESDGAFLSQQRSVLESQQQRSNTLLLARNHEIIDTITGNYTDDHTHQRSTAVLIGKSGSRGAVMIEKGLELSRNERNETGLAKRPFCQSCSDSLFSPPNDLSNENNQSQSVLPTGSKLLSRQNCGMEKLTESCRAYGYVSGNSAVCVKRQGTSEAECVSNADLHERNVIETSSELNGLSVGEDSLSDKSDMLVLTCEDAGDNAAIFLEEAEDHFSENSDVIMLCCNDSLQNCREKDSEAAHFNAAMSSPQEQCTFQETDTGNASKDHVVSAAVLLKGNQSSYENGNQKSKHFDEGIQKNPKEKSSQKSSEETIIEKFNKNCYIDTQNCLEDDNKKSSKEVCQALRSGSCEDTVVNKVNRANLAKFRAANEPDLSPNWKHKVLHPQGKRTSRRKSRRLHLQGNVLFLADKLTSKKNSKVKTKPRKSKSIRKTKTPSYVIDSHVTPPDGIDQNSQTICSGDITTELSFNRFQKQTEGNLNESGVNEASYSCAETGRVNFCTEQSNTLNHGQNGIKLRIVKVRSGIWQAQSSTDPVTQHQKPCSHKDCTVSSDDLSSHQDLIYVSNDSDTDSQDCLCVDNESYPPNNRSRMSAKWMTTLLPTSAPLHRLGCKCVSCAEQQFLYGCDNSASMFTEVSLSRDLMRHKRLMSENRSLSPVHSVASVGQLSPIFIDILDGNNSDKPIYIV